MGFTKFTKNVLNVSALPDRVQNQASSLKLVFDQAGVDIKAALNALISELEAKVAAANIGADVASVTEKNVQGILTAFENEIANRYTKAETNNAILADTNELIADVKIDLATGLLTVTKKNGTKQTFETSTEAESYAVGGTGTRPGEDTDNAKYYAQIAKQVAGGDFVTVVEMEGYAQKKGLYPNYNETELKGEVIETETTLESESTLKLYGNSVQETRSGKNLVSSTMAGFVSSSGVVTDGVGNLLSNFIEVENNKNYILSGYTADFTRIARAYQIAFYDSDYNFISRQIGIAHNTAITITNTNVKYVRGWIDRASSNDALPTYLQIEEGSTATSYEPYGASPSPEFESPIMSVSGDVEARVEGKNLFDMDSWTVFDKQSDGSYKSKSTLYPDTSKINVDLPIGVYTLSYKVKCEVGKNYRVMATYEDGETSKGAVISTGDYVEASIVLANKKISYLTVSYTQKSSDVYIKDLMLNKGTTALPYEPYKAKTISVPLGDIELRSTPDGTRDTFVRKDGVWNVVGNIGKYSLDNTGDIRINEGYSSENYRCFYYNKTNGIWVNPGTSGYTEKFQIVTAVKELDSLDKPVMYLSGGTYKQVFIKVKNDITTVDEFKAQIVNTPIDVIVPLTTPTYTPITDPALISALDELEQLVLHKGYNRITVTGVNGVKAQLELEIAPTALLTNISETEAGLNMPVPVVAETGDVLIKVPKAENQMTINPATGVVNVKGLTINGVSLDAYIRSIIG